MPNYDEIPLFPLHVVLYPDMPLPLHIFEPRYREMIHHCREENLQFGVVLIESGVDDSDDAYPSGVGTMARITHYVELPDGRMNIVVSGETRFRIKETYHHKPYLTARVEPFWEQMSDPVLLKPRFDTVTALFKAYLKSILSISGRRLSAVQLPQEAEYLSYAIASVVQIPLPEKQRLLEMTDTAERLAREIEILGQEIETQSVMRAVRRDVQTDPESVVVPVDTQALGKLSSLN